PSPRRCGGGAFERTRPRPARSDHRSGSIHSAGPGGARGAHRGKCVSRRAHPRPDPVHAAGAWVEPLPYADPRPVSVRRRRASRGRDRGRGGPARGPADPEGGVMTSAFRKTTETYRQGARTMPGRYYTSSEVFAEEAERVFRRRWICVGRATAIPDPGDYLTAGIAAESILVVRDTTGVARAFYNVCRHRGTRLC